MPIIFDLLGITLFENRNDHSYFLDINYLIFHNIIKKGETMQKEELIQIHTFLLQLRTQLENMTNNNNSKAFLSYDNLRIGPHKINRDKNDHKLAIFEVSKGIANLMLENNCSTFQRIYDYLEKMCIRFR